MVAFAHETSPHDRRATLRRQPTVGTVCQLSSSAGQELGTALVWNISLNGVSMLLPRRVDPGSTLQAELKTASALHTLPILLRVAHIAQLKTGDFVLGAQFTRHLEEGEMQPFLG
jgi:hypothetical protein